MAAPAQGRQLVRGTPHARRQSGQHRRAQRRGFGHFRPPYRASEDVGLKLHQVAVGGGAAVGAELAHAPSAVLLHRGQGVAHLVGDRIERRAHHVGAIGAARYPDDRAARAGVPVWRAETDEGRNQVRLRAIAA